MSRTDAIDVLRWLRSELDRYADAYTRYDGEPLPGPYVCGVCNEPDDDWCDRCRFVAQGTVDYDVCPCHERQEMLFRAARVIERSLANAEDGGQ